MKRQIKVQKHEYQFIPLYDVQEFKGFKAHRFSTNAATVDAHVLKSDPENDHQKLLLSQDENVTFSEEQLDFELSKENFYPGNLEFRKALLFSHFPDVWTRFPASMFDSEAGISIVEKQKSISREQDAKDSAQIRFWKILCKSILQHLDSFPNSFDVADLELTDVKTGKVQNLIPGDHIERTQVFMPKSPVNHHSIYIGRGYLVDVNGPTPHDPVKLGNLAKVQSPFQARGTKSSLSGAKMYVRVIKMKDYLLEMSSATAEIFVRNHPQPLSGERIRTRRETVELAMSLLGVWNYNLWHSNCEVFANYCVRGTGISDQAEKILALNPTEKFSKHLEKFGQIHVVDSSLKIQGVEKTLDLASSLKDHFQKKGGVSPTPELKKNLKGQVVEMTSTKATILMPDPWLKKLILITDDREKLKNTFEAQQKAKIPFHHPLTGAYMEAQSVFEISNILGK